MADDGAELRSRTIALPGRGGAAKAWEIGPQNRTVDLVLSHANGFNGRTYRTIVAPIADHYRILLLDQRGHGRCELPADTATPRNSWDDLAADLGEILAVLDLQDVVLAGHSMGGTVSTMAAAAAPSRVSGLVLLDPVVLPPEMVAEGRAGRLTESPLVVGARKRRSTFPSFEAVIQAYTGRGAFGSWTSAMLADYVADGFRTTANGEVELSCAPAWEASGFMAQGHDPWSAFDSLRLPIHILKAETGSTCRIDGLEDRVLAGGEVQIETIAGTSHFLPMERPDLVQAAVVAMLERRN